MAYLLKQGRSWSGNERNICFLNTADEKFADFSGLTGFDFAEDSRAVALTDWDHDGAVDLWTTNRTSPRVRMMRNSGHSGHHFLAIRLFGTRCNRDAIGALVEVRADDPAAKPLVRCVHAGSGYLSQSSKWLYFGLGTNTRVGQVVVHWPGGEVQELPQLVVDRHYHLVQGEDAARVWRRDGEARALCPSPGFVASDAGLVRLVPHARLPMPILSDLHADGSRQDVNPPAGRAQLVVLWASWCQPCLSEMSMLQRSQRALRDLGLEIILLNVDDLDAPARQRAEQMQELLARLQIDLPAGLANRATVERLDAVQQSLTSREETLSMPSSFLIDRDGRLAALYRGSVDAEQLSRDAARVARTSSDSERRNEPLPMAGRWFVNPLPVDILAIPRKLLQKEDPESALAYLRRWVPTASANSASSVHAPARDVADVYFDAGMQLARAGQLIGAAESFRTALSYASDHVQCRAALASIYSQQHESAAALAEYQAIVRLAPHNTLALNNVAWILAACPDDSIRDPKQALQLAQRAVDATQSKAVPALDTLAVAYAACGDFEKALDTSLQAIELAKQTGQFRQLANLQARVALYREGRPFLDQRLLK